MHMQSAKSRHTETDQRMYGTGQDVPAAAAAPESFVTTPWAQIPRAGDEAPLVLVVLQTAGGE